MKTKPGSVTQVLRTALVALASATLLAAPAVPALDSIDTIINPNNHTHGPPA